MSEEKAPRRLEVDKPLTVAEMREKAGLPKKVYRNPVPQLPSLGVDPAEVRTADQRSKACLELKLNGAPFHEIAEQLGYASPEQAKAAYIAALASLSSPEDFDTLRQVEALRAERLFARSWAMAKADVLIVHSVEKDEDGNEVEVEKYVANEDKFRWHEQAAKDLMMHAIITGAKAPARVEVTAETQELNQMVQVLLARRAADEQKEIEADIFDAELIPDEPEGLGE